MFFNKKEDKSNESSFVKIGALLIHAAKIDENYSKEEEEIIKEEKVNEEEGRNEKVHEGKGINK